MISSYERLDSGQQQMRYIILYIQHIKESSSTKL